MSSEVVCFVVVSTGGGRRPQVGLVGDIDIATADLAESVVRDALRDGRSISIDMGLVTFFGAPGARLIAGLLQDGIDVELVDVPPAAKRVLGLCGMIGDPLLTVREL